MQRCVLNPAWDERLSCETVDEWIEFRRDLKNLNKLNISRQALFEDSYKIELHGFSDASHRAYGAAYTSIQLIVMGEGLIYFAQKVVLHL